MRRKWSMPQRLLYSLYVERHALLLKRGSAIILFLLGEKMKLFILMYFEKNICPAFFPLTHPSFHFFQEINHAFCFKFHPSHP